MHLGPASAPAPDGHEGGAGAHGAGEGDLQVPTAAVGQGQLHLHVLQRTDGVGVAGAGRHILPHAHDWQDGAGGQGLSCWPAGGGPGRVWAQILKPTLSLFRQARLPMSTPQVAMGGVGRRQVQKQVEEGWGRWQVGGGSNGRDGRRETSCGEVGTKAKLDAGILWAEGRAHVRVCTI